MGWDATNKVLSLPFTKIAANGSGDLQQALGRSTPRSHIQLIKDVDSNGNRVGAINKWARYKPIPRPNVSYADQLKTVDGKLVWKSLSELSAASQVPWWIGNDGQCGLSFTTYESLGSQAMSTSGRFFHDLLQGLPWTYNTPAGSSTEPLRAYDFNEYYHAAAKPVEGVNDTYQLTQNGTLTIQLVENRGYNDGYNDVALSLSDFTINSVAGADFYVGILIWRSNSIFTFKTSQTKVSGGDLTCVFTNMAGNYGGQDVTIVPFLSSKSITQGQDTQTGVYLSADVLPKTVHINAYQSPYTLTALAQWKDSMYAAVLYDVRLYNNTSTAVSNDTITLKVYRSGQSSAIGTATRSSISVAANSYTDVTNWNIGIVVSDTHSATATYTLEVTSSSGHWSTTTVVEAPRA